MKEKSDFVPRKDAEYSVFFSNIERAVDTKTHGPNPPWTHIPEADAQTLTRTLNGWLDAYTPTLSPHTPEATREKRRVRESSEKYLRHFINQFLRYSDKVTDAERDQLGIPNENSGKSPVADPETAPVFTVEIAGPGRLTLRLREEGSSRTAIPYGYSGAVIYWKILDEPTDDPKTLSESELATTAIHTLYFDEPDWGKKVYISARWQTRGGKRGPYSPIQESVIP